MISPGYAIMAEQFHMSYNSLNGVSRYRHSW